MAWRSKWRMKEIEIASEDVFPSSSLLHFIGHTFNSLFIFHYHAFVMSDSFLETLADTSFKHKAALSVQLICK